VGRIDVPSLAGERAGTLTQDETPHVCVAANTTWYVHNFRGRLIAELIQRGYRVTVLSPADRYVGKVTALGAQHVALPMSSASTNPFSELVTLIGIARLLRRIRPTVLLTYTPKVNIYAAIAARVLGITVVANVSGLGRAFTAGGWLEVVARRLYWVALHTPRIVFFQNEDDRAEFVKAGLVEQEKTYRLPGSGVDVDRFQPTERNPGKKEFVFLLVARLLWDKGVGEYVEAARMLRTEFPWARFRLLGFLDVKNPSAITRNQVEAWGKEGLIEYLGEVEDVRGVYAEVNCMVLPSYYREGVPRTLLEGASMGIPIITADSVGCRDTVEDGKTGFLCRPRDAGDLANKMLRMLSLPEEERRRMGQAGREKMIREFDERIVINKYLQVVEEIVKKEFATDRI
jgi:glycosyltransferase involved in cell wall biosynthesis